MESWAGSARRRAIQQFTYAVKHGSAKNLAPVLAKHFKGVAEIQVVADSPENAWLISAPPAVLKEVVAVLGQLDRKPRQIAVDVWAGVVVADGAAPNAADAAAAQRKEPDQQLDLREFTGPVAKVLPKVAALALSPGALDNGSISRVALWKTKCSPSTTRK